MVAMVHRRADGADHGEDLVLLHHLLRREQALLRVVAAVLDDQLDLAAVMPPASLISSTRICMPLRSGLLKPASGPDRSWMEPITISSLVTPICWRRSPYCQASPATASASHGQFHAFHVHGLLSLWVLPNHPDQSRYMDSISSAYF
jgi:hypothetical protein